MYDAVNLLPGSQSNEQPLTGARATLVISRPSHAILDRDGARVETVYENLPGPVQITRKTGGAAVSRGYLP